MLSVCARTGIVQMLSGTTSDIDFNGEIFQYYQITRVLRVHEMHAKISLLEKQFLTKRGGHVNFMHAQPARLQPMGIDSISVWSTISLLPMCSGLGCYFPVPSTVEWENKRGIVTDNMLNDSRREREFRM